MKTASIILFLAFFSAQAEEPVWFWDTAAESSLGELKGRARLGPNLELLLDHGSFRSVNFEPFDGDAFSIQLQATRFDEDSGGEILGWGSLKFSDLFPRQLPKSAHLALVFREDEFSAYVDGKSVNSGSLDFEPGETLVFGEGWAGAIEGIEVFDRAIDPDEIKNHAAKIQKRIAERVPRRPSRVKAKLIQSTPTPEVDEIAPYRAATVENVFEILSHESGPEVAAGRIVVVQWAILDRQPLESRLEVGESATLELEPLSTHPELQGGLRKRAHNDLEAPAFFDLRSHEPLPEPKSSPAAAASKHWAFQPIRRPEIPDGQHPVDFFVDRKLKELGFEPVPKADERTLARRLSYGLHGLPPDDLSLDLDRLLASPRYGERWARHWLDVARYADTKDGVLMYGDNRMRPFAYTYRDYVIRSFNDDKPFDQFIREQLAADQLGLDEERAALGFLTLGRMFDNNPYDVIDDQIDVVMRGLSGLTVSCARCHDHKYDPIPTTDYYALYGVFANSEEPLERPRIEAPKDEEFEKQLAKQLDEILNMRREQHALLTEAARKQTLAYLERVSTTNPDVSETAQFFLSLQPEDLRPQITSRWRNLVARKPEALQFGERLIEEFEQLLPGETRPWDFPESETWFYMSRKDKDAYRGKVNQLDQLATKAPNAAARAMSLTDAEKFVEPVVFVRGNPSQPGERVPRRFLTILDPDSEPFTRGSGRLDLAEAIVHPENPLTARVLVNRIWMHHFGAPLVESPSDFGVRTPPPSHPELLDFLASELIGNGWRLKPIHRLILSSQTYQRSSIIPEIEQFRRQQLRDPDNRWLWRANRRRLDMESMRDTLLALSGQLETTMFGRPMRIDDPRNQRRSVYALVERQSAPEIFRIFDFANPDTSVACRIETTVPQQALFVMNSSFVRRAAAEACRDTTVAELHQRILGREPTPEEWRDAAEFLETGSFEAWAQVLMMSNELMFID